MVKSIKVPLTLKSNENVAREAAFAVLTRSNPHASTLIEDKLKDAGITLESLTKYFMQVGTVVSQFWNAQHDIAYVPVLKSHEVRNLYLPLIYGVIFASVGNCKIGNYEYQIFANDSVESELDKRWILDFSVKLESMRDYVFGDINQIGNYAAQPQTTVMMSLLGTVASDGRGAELLIRDSVSYDKALAGIAALVGLSIVNETYNILYPGIDEVNFRELIGTIVQK